MQLGPVMQQLLVKAAQAGCTGGASQRTVNWNSEKAESRDRCRASFSRGVTGSTPGPTARSDKADAQQADERCWVGPLQMGKHSSRTDMSCHLLQLGSREGTDG